MIRAQRKSHYRVWLLLALLLPAGIAAAWLVIPVPARQWLMQPATVSALPLEFAARNTASYKLRVKTDESKKHWQLEWNNVAALTVPSCLLYQAPDAAAGIESSELIGRIGERGIYRFAVNAPRNRTGFHFIRYDIIHQQILDRIDIKP